MTKGRQFTAEDQAKAAEARRAAVEAGAHYRRDFADADRWLELAQARGITLPQWHEAPTPGKLRYWLQTLVGKPFRDVYGYKQVGQRAVPLTPQDLIDRNPDWPLRAFFGVMLEAAE